MTFRDISNQYYTEIKTTTRANWLDPRISVLIHKLVTSSISFLLDAQSLPCVSKVPGKSYQTFSRDGLLSRAVNLDLFLDDPRKIPLDYRQWRNDPRILYTIAVAPCAAFDLLKSGDKKRPATYFEKIIGFLAATNLRVEPDNRFNIVDDLGTRMTADFIFAMPQYSLHLAVKTSSRERASQAWSHQHILSQRHPNMHGIFVILAETKLDHKSLEVIEICVPNQWAGYQTYTTQMHRVYYLDAPDTYLGLNERFPDLVQPFTNFFGTA